MLLHVLGKYTSSEVEFTDDDEPAKKKQKSNTEKTVLFYQLVEPLKIHQILSNADEIVYKALLFKKIGKSGPKIATLEALLETLELGASVSDELALFCWSSVGYMRSSKTNGRKKKKKKNCEK